MHSLISLIRTETVAFGLTFVIVTESDPEPDSDGAMADAGGNDPKPDSDGGAGGPIKVWVLAVGLL